MFQAKVLSIITCLSFIAVAGNSQQVADTLYTPVIQDPAYEPGEGSVILIDESHSNFHTAGGRFSPFVRVLEKDGYVVQSSLESLSKEELSSGKILVIANALHASNLGNWTLPTPSAFSDAEIAAVNDWVNKGGSLFLIADHMPFAGAAEKLAASFGFKVYNGFAMKQGSKDIFTLGDGLMTNVVTMGRNEKEMVKSLQTFTGMAFEIPVAAQSVIVLGKDYEVRIPKTAWAFDKETTNVSGENLVQGAYMPYGKGKLMIFGEAAMFTAQLQGSNKIGMNSKSASQNAQFLLNAIHWLDGLLK